MILKNCKKKTKKEIINLLDSVIGQIIKVEEHRNKGLHYGYFPKHINNMIDKTFIYMLNVGTTKGSDVYISDEVVDYINSYEMVDFLDELEEMKMLGKFEIER